MVLTQIDDGSKMLLVAAMTATASSLLTYAIFRRHHRRELLNEALDTGASTVTPLRPAARTPDVPSVSMVSAGGAPRSKADPYDPRPRSG